MSREQISTSNSYYENIFEEFFYHQQVHDQFQQKQGKKKAAKRQHRYHSAGVEEAVMSEIIDPDEQLRFQTIHNAR